ncbi:MAG: hypothetical protein U0326_06620 [Polyangiales bacterium]
MDIDGIVNALKSQVLGSLEEKVYEQAVAANLVDTVLRELVEAAVERLQVQMPAAVSGVGALLGFLGSVAPTVQSLGLDTHVSGLIKQLGVDTAMRDSVIRGITRYLEANGAHLMEVAVKAAVQKLTKTS